MRGWGRVLLAVARWRANRKRNKVRRVICPERERKKSLENTVVGSRHASKHVGLSLELWKLGSEIPIWRSMENRMVMKKVIA